MKKIKEIIDKPLTDEEKKIMGEMKKDWKIIQSTIFDKYENGNVIIILDEIGETDND